MTVDYFPLNEEELERVADAATAMLAKIGWRNIGLHDVATVAEVDPAALREAVEDQSGLLTLVLENRDLTDIEAVRALRGAEPLEPVKALHDLVAHNAGQVEIVRLYTVLAGESIDPRHPAHEYFQRRYLEMIDIMVDIVDGHVPDPDTTGIQIIALMDGLQLQWLRDPDHYNLVAEWDRAASRILSA